ncbi:MAG: M20 family metallopeptidase [Dehalococcoidales bacterium]|nr:M20 family metallopeptidase [Dehalococcoidales bacterium]
MAWTESFLRFAASETLPLLQALVAAPSVNPPGHEDLAARPLADFSERHRLEPHWQDTEPGRPNLLVTATGSSPGRTLALCSHLDVVPPGDLVLWTGDPFSPRLEDRRLYGRGACDAKGALTAMAVAVAFWSRQGLARGRLVLAAVCGEERGGTGAKALVASGFQADGVVIGEPTGLRVLLGHKGRIQITANIAGRGGHASLPERAANPIERLGLVLERLQALSGQVRTRTHPLVGAASLTATQVSSGDTNAATIPQRVTVVLDRRLLPGESQDEAAGEVVAALAGLPDVDVEWRRGAQPYVLSRDEPLVGACQTGVIAARGSAAPPGGFVATCDQYVFGLAGIPTTILGPGDLVANRTHAPDEFIELAEVESAALAYAATAHAFLEV